MLMLSIVFVVFSIYKGAKVQNEEPSKDILQVDENLYDQIRAYSELHRLEPIDAVNDRVWKSIPGYNGLEVDVKASYEAMQASGFDTNKVVFRQIAPKIHLKDLEPQPIFRGNPHKPMAAFLINVAWGNDFIPKMLQSLNKHGVKATFFFDGSWLKKNPELAASIAAEGHELGNHAYSHPDLQKRTGAETLEELKKTNEVIEETLGVKPEWFAPPSGSFNQTTVEVARRLGMYTILWTVDTVDWKKPSTEEMVQRVVSKVENGSMILMHPTEPSSEGLETMITRINSKGYRLGTVGELMSEERIY